MIVKYFKDISNPIIKQNVKTVFYEDLVLKPRQTIESVLDFINEPWNDRVLEYTKFAFYNDQYLGKSSEKKS